MELILNTTPLSERGGYAAFQLTYGSNDQTTQQIEMLTELTGRGRWTRVMKRFDGILGKVRASSFFANLPNACFMFGNGHPLECVALLKNRKSTQKR